MKGFQHQSSVLFIATRNGREPQKASDRFVSAAHLFIRDLLLGLEVTDSEITFFTPLNTNYV